MKKIYEAWEDLTDNSISLSRAEEVERQRLLGGINKEARLLYKIEAHTFEEAACIHSLRMGWGAYTPCGDPARCAKCNAWYYPKGSGECWRCG